MPTNKGLPGVLVLPPRAFQLFFQQSSVWILLLAVMAISSRPVFATLLATTALSSWGHWTNFAPGSKLAIIDRYQACCVILYVAYFNHSLLVCALNTASVVFFVAGQQAFLRRRWLWHLTLHAMFRYCAFWGIGTFLHHPTYTMAFCCSAAYWFHFVCTVYAVCSAEFHDASRGLLRPHKNEPNEAKIEGNLGCY